MTSGLLAPSQGWRKGYGSANTAAHSSCSWEELSSSRDAYPKRPELLCPGDFPLVLAPSSISRLGLSISQLTNPVFFFFQIPKTEGEGPLVPWHSLGWWAQASIQPASTWGGSASKAAEAKGTFLLFSFRTLGFLCFFPFLSQ